MADDAAEVGEYASNKDLFGIDDEADAGDAYEYYYAADDADAFERRGDDAPDDGAEGPGGGTQQSGEAALGDRILCRGPPAPRPGTTRL